MADTTYVILKRVGLETRERAKETETVFGDGGWHEIGKQVAGSPEGAVRAFLNADENGDKYGEGNYRGVAERSWGDPVPIQKKISFG